MRRAPWLLPLVALVACVASDQPSPSGSTARVAPNPIPVAQASAAELPQASLGLPDVELDRLRDPFQRIDPTTPPDDPHKRERNAALPDTPIQDLRVKGTVRSGLAAYAILVNDRGESAVVPLGHAVGAEIKDKKGDYDWRLDRVRDGEVILKGEASDGAPKTYKIKSAQGWKT